MDKEQINKVNETKTLALMPEEADVRSDYGITDLYLSKEILNDWGNLKLNSKYYENIETLQIFSYIWDFDFFSDLSLLKNLKNLYFYGSDLSKTEKYINEGLKKIKNLKRLGLTATNLNKLPDIDFSKIELTSLLGNKFYKQNFHFKLKKEENQIEIEEDILLSGFSVGHLMVFIQGLLSEGNYQFKKNFIDVFGVEVNSEENYQFKENFIDVFGEEVNLFGREPLIRFRGITNKDKSIIILHDSYIENYLKIPSISVYVLGDLDRYKVFNTFRELFSELNKKLDCFKTIKGSKKELETFLFYNQDFHESDAIEFETLKQNQKTGNRKFNEHFTSDLVEYLGGKELIKEIEQERQKEQEQQTEIFFKENSFIASAEISNFKLFNKLNVIELSDKVNILVGKNGTGKTSLLQSFALGLIPDNSDEIKDRNFNRLDAYVNKNAEDDTYAEIKVLWSGGFERKLRVYSDELLQDKAIPQTYLALAYGENLFVDKTYPIKEHIDGLDTGNYKTHHVASIFNNYFIELPNPLEILDKLQDAEIPPKYSSEKKQELISIRKLLLNTLNNFLEIQPIKHLRIEQKDRYFKFIDRNETELSLYQISEGYRSNIVLLTDIFVKILSARKKLFIEEVKLEDIFKNVKGTIIIDEFDKHLHPVWQRTFINSLTGILPNIQFILTTHNILALQSAEGEKAFILDNLTETLKPERINLGYSIESIYDKFFDGNNQYFGTETKKRLDKFKLKKEQVLETNDFSILEDKGFIRLVNELQALSSEIAIIIEGEIGQLKIKKRNAEAKKN